MNISEEVLNNLIGQRIKTERSRLKWTQEKLAKESGVSRATVAVIEVGKQRTPLNVLYKLCLALDIEVRNIIPSNKEIGFDSEPGPFSNLPITAHFVEASKKKLEMEITGDSE